MRRTRAAMVTAAAILMTFPGCRREVGEDAPDLARQEGPAQATPGAPAGGSAEPQPNGQGTPSPDGFTWEQAVARVEEVRGGGSPVQVPVELRHYTDRRKFLAIQIADSQANNFDLPHDMGELAIMIRKGDMVELPRLGRDHMLYEVGEDAREDPLEHWDPSTGQDVPLIGSEAELQGQLASATPAFKQVLERHYGDPTKREQLFREHEAVTALARDFGGRSYDLSDNAQRAEFQRRMLSFVRPAARDVVMEIAQGYNAQFQRPLPITSIIRTQRYQRRLSRVNANATKIDIPPHTTGMAFDISYKYMGPAEQNWVMGEVARLEREGRVEALREKRNHLHIYAFADERPADVQVAQYLDDVGPVARAQVRPARHVKKKAPARSRAASRKTRRAR
jgi:hypothetical protein